MLNHCEVGVGQIFCFPSFQLGRLVDLWIFFQDCPIIQSLRPHGQGPAPLEPNYLQRSPEKMEKTASFQQRSDSCHSHELWNCGDIYDISFSVSQHISTIAGYAWKSGWPQNLLFPTLRFPSLLLSAPTFGTDGSSLQARPQVKIWPRNNHTSSEAVVKKLQQSYR